jgi:tellurite resistance protein
MFKVRRRRRDAERRLSAEGRALAGLVDACMVMACADGELADEEFEVIAQVIDGFFDGHVTRADIETLMQDSLDAIEREGIPARLASAAGHLESVELRELGLAAAATVMLSDGELAQGEEDELYDQLAQALEIPRRRASEILTEVDDSLE